MSFLKFYQSMSESIDPIVFTIGSFSVKWYSLAYLVAFLVTYFLMNYRIRKGEGGEFWNKKCGNTLDFLMVLFLGLILGARLGYIIFYAPEYFWENPLRIISPFDEDEGFVGLYGMSYHGGAIGLALAALWFSNKNKIDFWRLMDFFVPCVSLGYFFGRIGNFLNGELVGRVTEGVWGVRFGADEFLRHPSQLYEAFFEGLVIFLILWPLRNSLKRNRGIASALYVILYGFFRFFLEFFREPDAGYELFFGFITKGQILSAGMILLGFFVIIFIKRNKR